MNKSTLTGALALFALLGAAGMVHAEDTLKKIKDSGAVTMGVRESSGALAFTLGDGKYTGFHYDVCQRVLSDVQKQLGLATLQVKYQPVTSQNRIPLVQNGTVDIECGSTTNNAQRQKDVAFAPTLYVEEVRIAVKANSSITGIKDLGGKTIAPPPARPRCRPCARTSAHPAWTSRSCRARTTRTAFCCSNPAAPTPS